MTQNNDFIREYAENVERLKGLYDPSQERDSCGVGLVASLDGKRNAKKTPGQQGAKGHLAISCNEKNEKFSDF
ncbi:hypothetical protein AD939_01050, partial [Gluconobacter oxydans]|uniref:hypothetical protein n=1 Tax=Gluconobacter oxydans TaxID=442 RepID=UPI00079A4412